MKKPPTKWRYVRYEDDGVSLFECLSCKGKWAARHITHNFCPSCGVKFEGEHKWDEDKKNRELPWPEVPPETRWVIEKRIPKQYWEARHGSSRVPCDGDWGPWEVCRDYAAFHCPAIDKCRLVLKDFKMYVHREGLSRQADSFHFFDTEYRVRLTLETSLPSDLESVPEDYNIMELEEELARTYRLMRQDDLGNRFVVERGLKRSLAFEKRQSFEDKGHKQTYWVEKEDDVNA